jgi:hypothetical protein
LIHSLVSIAAHVGNEGWHLLLAGRIGAARHAAFGGRRPQHSWKFGAAMKWLKTLNNPFLLGLQGFLAGAVLFFATHPEAVNLRTAPAAEQSNSQSMRAPA